jgi:hypothetical protein
LSRLGAGPVTSAIDCGLRRTFDLGAPANRSRFSVLDHAPPAAVRVLVRVAGRRPFAPPSGMKNPERVMPAGSKMWATMSS